MSKREEFLKENAWSVNNISFSKSESGSWIARSDLKAYAELVISDYKDSLISECENDYIDKDV